MLPLMSRVVQFIVCCRLNSRLLGRAVYRVYWDLSPFQNFKPNPFDILSGSHYTGDKMAFMPVYRDETPKF